MATFKLGGLVEQIASTATAGGTTTLINSSRQVQVFTGTLAQSVVLPDATTMSVGQKFEIYNTSTGIVTLKFNDGSTVQAISPSSSYIVKLTNNGTSNGTFVNIASSGSASPGVGQVKYLDTTLTTLPTATPYAPDGTNVVSNDVVLFTALSSNNNEAYKATVTGGTIAWAAVQIGQNNNATPTIGDFAYIQSGTIYAKQLWTYNGTLWESLDGNGLGWNNGQLMVTSPNALNYISGNPDAEISTAGWATYSDTQTATFTNGSANIGLPNVTGLYVGMPLTFTSSGTLPTNFTSGTKYFITSIVTLNIQVSATLGGTAVSAGSAGTGTQTFRPFVPATGTGGTISGLTFTRSTSSPLIGNASFLLTQSNTTVVAGQGASYDFTIDSAYQAQVLSVNFMYNASSTFVGSSGAAGSDSDLEIFVYDKTNATLMQLSPKTITAIGTNNFAFNGVFQTSSNSTSYRLIIHSASSNNNATGWTFKFDGVQVGPQRISNGTPMTDLVDAGAIGITAITTSPVKGTTSRDKVYWRREGQYAYIYYEYNQTAVGSGTNGSGDYLFALPTGLVADSTYVTFNSSVVSTKQWWPAQGSFIGNEGGATQSELYAVMYDSTHFRILGLIGGTNAVVGSGTNFGLSNPTPQLGGWIKIPIVGWSSNVQMSSDADTRVVAAKATSLSTFTTGNPVIYGTTTYDTHGAYNSSTGRYTVPVSGIYRITSYFDMSGSPIFAIYKNAVAGNNIGRPSANIGLISGQVQCQAGDIIDLRANGGSGAISNSYEITFEKINGPAAIAATEKVLAGYSVSANFTASTTVPINFDTVEYDTHSAVTTSATAWKFTAPSSGYYNIEVFASANVVSLITLIYKNGSAYKDISYTNSNFGQSFGSTIILLNAGDFIDIRPTASRTMLGGAINSSTGATTFIAIARI